MNQTLFYYISNYSIGIAAIVAIFKFKKAASSFLPFFIFIWLGFANEVLSYFTAHYLRNTNVNNNIYVLLESLLLLWQFTCWRLFDSNRLLPKILAAAFVLFWIAECFIFADILYVAGYFRVFYSFVIVLLSISMMNQLITSERGNLLKNAAFIICIAFVIFFTYKILIEIFYIYGLFTSNREFRLRVFNIMRYINLFCNLVYAAALLWVPKKSSSLMPS